MENIFIYPFILVGRLIAFLKPLQKEYDIFFFFPFYHTGGAEKVHALITQAVGNNNCIIFFTRKSGDDTFLQDFKKSGCIIKDISSYTDNKWLYFFNLIYRGIVTGYINKQSSKPVVFNGQSNFGYKISPWIKRKIRQVELIHALNTFSFIRIPFIGFYNESLTVSQEIIDKHLDIYMRVQIPISLIHNFSFIESKIDLPTKKTVKDTYSSVLHILYVGRGSFEKRVHLCGMIAKEVITQNRQIQFHFAGDVKNSVPEEYHTYCTFHGDIRDTATLNALYDLCHVLVVTSSTESGPLVVLEAMARGLAIITTNVGFAPNYIADGVNGFKIQPHIKEHKIVEMMCADVLLLFNDRSLLQKMSLENSKIAYENFGIEKFNEKYKAAI
jgi:glycosyltransferase involved in cell wall biosynthesis